MQLEGESNIMTTTDILFYGGLAAMAAAILLLMILIPVFRAQRKRLVKKIENGDL